MHKRREIFKRFTPVSILSQGTLSNEEGNGHAATANSNSKYNNCGMHRAEHLQGLLLK